MKKRIPVYIMTLLASALVFNSMIAQETTEVSIKVTKDGRVVKDTTYQFDDADEAKNAIKMMEVMTGDKEHVMKYNYTTGSEDAKHANTIVFVSKEGGKTEIKELHGDSLVWVTEKEGDGENVKIIKRKMIGGEHPHGEHVIVMKSGDGETFDILIDEDVEAGEGVKKKTMNVFVEKDEKGTWHVDEDIYIIKEGDDVEIEIKKIIEEHDIDQDQDKDIEKEVEVKVEKKVKKKSK